MTENVHKQENEMVDNEAVQKGEIITIYKGSTLRAVYHIDFCAHVFCNVCLACITWKSIG